MPTRPPDTDDERADGERILFFVQALYDYRATIDEEFDFEEGDIIAVKATPDDGWWSGELLDEKRRVEGRHIFPSNFITLF
ncbi:SH3 domain-containing protein [Mycena indigotica]|uniref:SH3 domain-containing protein n=1 Tax=Mycena indigotica TaxID=2126181 RepID=A0A8H6SEY3_9AGAR|nr:SH3 domain-containing protein [Mycena indigotica]KAF7297476.1 SH3 domain-containing protein [Mycena indigotica]